MTFSVQPIVSPTDIANSIGSVVAVGTIRANEGVNMSVSTPAGVERLPLTDGGSQVLFDNLSAGLSTRPRATPVT